MRAPKSDKLDDVEQTNVRLRECIDEAERLCESASKLTHKDEVETAIEIQPPMPPVA